MLDFQLVSYFTNFAVHNVTKVFVYITDLTSALIETDYYYIQYMKQSLVLSISSNDVNWYR